MIFLRLKLIFVFISLSWVEAKKESLARRFEDEGCETLIPSFIDQILENGENDGECHETGEYPKPGDCTVFFKCIRGRGRIEPFIQYCAVGYIFDGTACIRNSNASDCPQYTCNPLKTFTNTTISNIQASDKLETEEVKNPYVTITANDSKTLEDKTNISKDSNTLTKVSETTNEDEDNQNELGFGLTVPAAQKSSNAENTGSTVFISIWFFSVPTIMALFETTILKRIFW